MTIIEQLDKKKILIWGYGKEGKSTENFLKRHCLSCEFVVFEGSSIDEIEQNYDFIIKSPGIPYFENNDKIISQTSLFIQEFSKQIIGITGTKGKSTTSSMLYNVLNQLGRKVILVGNIGKPCLDYYDLINTDTLIVYELSCHQLMDIKCSPHISILLNIYEEHLDYYKTMENYINAKLNIIRYQSVRDICIVNEDIRIPFQLNSKLLYPEKRIELHLSIEGEHQKINARIIYQIIVQIMGYDKNIVIKLIEKFKGLPHRLEKIGMLDGVTYYDDSISTICESTICAIESIKQINTVLIGGLDRGINYSMLVEYLQNRKDLNVICMYDSGKRIYRLLIDRQNTYFCNTLKEAVYLAKKITLKNRVCVLSPAAASYGDFKNFEERGEMYKQFVFENE